MAGTSISSCVQDLQRDFQMSVQPAEQAETEITLPPFKAVLAPFIDNLLRKYNFL